MSKSCPECDATLINNNSCKLCGWQRGESAAITIPDVCDGCRSEEIYRRFGKTERDEKGRLIGIDSKRFCYDCTKPIWRSWRDNYMDQILSGKPEPEARQFADGWDEKQNQARCKSTHKPQHEHKGAVNVASHLEGAI